MFNKNALLWYVPYCFYQYTVILQMECMNQPKNNNNKIEFLHWAICKYMLNSSI